MDTLELKFDSTCDCWVLEPINRKIFRFDRFKPITSNQTSNTRLSTDSVSSSFVPSPASQRNTCSAPALQQLPKSGLPSPTYFNANGLPKRSRGSFRETLSRFWTCFKPSVCSRTSKKEKQGKNKPGDASTNARSSVQSPLSHHAEYYSSMSAGERDENLKAVIIYCRKSTESTELVAEN